MATYFHSSSEIQAAAASDGLQTLLLMNNPPGSYLGFSDITPPQPQPPGGTNFLILNSNSPGGVPLNSLNLHHAPSKSSQPQQLVGIPLASTTTNPSADSHHDVSAFHGLVPRFPYNNLYSQTVELSAARDAPRAQQGLSLSLSSSQQPQQLPSTSCDDVRISNGESSMQKVLLSSKYLKAAQELLDEVVNVGKVVKSRGGESAKGADGQGNDLDLEGLLPEIDVAGGGGKEQNGKRRGELNTAERQEIQMKKAKLVNMLDEVEQRYRQYHHQMQIVISWFEQAGGIGSAKTYTALALQTISKQFRCLKDAIIGQIRAASKSLGEEESLGGKIDGSRMKYVDNQLRQQRALQQLGMIQHNAWRPQRGLPERSVSVLRAWLFEHFLHPYPKDSDKLMLAKQTGLTRSQVSNWFINARVRLWKPMVEEMYAEEMKEQEKNGSEERSGKSEQHEDSASKAAGPDKTPSMENQTKGYVLNQDLSINQNITSVTATSSAGLNTSYQSGFNLIRSAEMDSIAHRSPKQQRMSDMFHSPACIPSINMDTKAIDSESEHLSMKFDAERQHGDGFALLGGPTNFIGGFGSYPIAELGRFSGEQFPAPYSGNGVSLTLGLPHCENLTMSGPHQTFLQNQNMQLTTGVEIDDAHEYGSINTPTSNHSTRVYESINIQNRKGFAAQLLPDFVT